MDAKTAIIQVLIYLLILHHCLCFYFQMSLNSNITDVTHISFFQSRWRGVLHHVTNVHEWVFGDGGGPAQCEHADIEDSPHDAESKWIEPGCSAHEALAKTVLDTRFLNTLKYFVNFGYKISLYVMKQLYYNISFQVHVVGDNTQIIHDFDSYRIPVPCFGLMHDFFFIRHTGELENFHELLLMYAAKRFAYR